MATSDGTRGKTTVQGEGETGVEEAAEEAPDEWTVLADTYTSSLVPAFGPIYESIAKEVLVGGAVPSRVLDFGCGPGEPILTLRAKYKDSIETAVGVDSTPAMLEIAKERSGGKNEGGGGNEVSFVHVRRDCTMDDFKSAVGGGPFDVVVSAFVFQYLEIDRRVELMKALLSFSPTVLLATWGDRTNVSFLRALQTFGTWKGAGGKGDIRTTKMSDGPESRGSFAMSEKGPFQFMAEKIGTECTFSYETRQLPLAFPNIAALLRFLPFATNDDDFSEMLKLLNHWKQDDSSISIDDETHEIRFQTEVVFCSFSKAE